MKKYAKVEKMEGNNNNSGLVTEKQLKYIGFLRGKTGSEKFKETIKKIGLKEDVILKELTSEEASILIDELQKLVPQESTKKSSFKDRMEDYIDFETLLKEAHKKFKDRLNITTELVTAQDKTILFKATITIRGNGKKEQVFTAYGDATDENVNTMVKPHKIRVAETRAVVRSLRFALGVGMTAKEEVEG